MKEKFQIGWYNLKEDKEFTNTFEVASWYERVLVKAGKYPVFAKEFNYNHNEEKYTNQLKNLTITIILDGIITGDDTRSLFCDNVVSNNNLNKNIGKESTHLINPYTYLIAKDILENNSNIELLPQFEAQEINFISCFDDKLCKTYGIFKIA